MNWLIDRYFSKISASLSLDPGISYLVEHPQREDHLERIVREQGPPQLERFPIRHHAWTQYRHSIQIEKDDEKRWYRRVHQGPVTDPWIGNRGKDFRVLVQRHLDQPLGAHERSIRIRHLDSRFQFPLHHQLRCRRRHFWKQNRANVKVYHMIKYRRFRSNSLYRSWFFKID